MCLFLILQKTKLQTGYGFVHFEDSLSGIQAALAAVELMHNVIIDNVSYDCRMSDSLKLRLQGKQYSPPTAAMMISRAKSAAVPASNTPPTATRDIGFYQVTAPESVMDQRYGPAQRHSLSLLERQPVSVLPGTDLPHLRSASATVLMEEPPKAPFPVQEARQESIPVAGLRFENRALPSVPQLADPINKISATLRELNRPSIDEDEEFFKRELRMNSSFLEHRLQRPRNAAVLNYQSEDSLPHKNITPAPFWQKWVDSVNEESSSPPLSARSNGSVWSTNHRYGDSGSTLLDSASYHRENYYSSLSTASTASGVMTEDGRRISINPDFRCSSIDFGQNFNVLSPKAAGHVDRHLPLSRSQWHHGRQQQQAALCQASLLPTTRSAQDQYAVSMGQRHGEASPRLRMMNDLPVRQAFWPDVTQI